MQYIVKDEVFKEIIPLPTKEGTEELTYKVFLGSDGSVFAEGDLTYIAGIQWSCSFTPDTLNEIYIIEVYDEEEDVIFSQSYKALGSLLGAETGVIGNLEVGVNTWVTGQEAEDYFITRFGIGSTWNSLSDDDKIRALITSYYQLNGCGDFEFPTDITENMKKAQCEMALFIIRHQEDADIRGGLQAQGVIKAGIVQEEYKEIKGIPIPIIVLKMLQDYEVASPILSIDLKRDENTNESIN